MLHAYITMYGICFITTVMLLIMFLIIGELDEREKGTCEAKETTVKDWAVYLLRACLIAFAVSFAAPLMLVFYTLILGCIIISGIEDN